MFDWKPESLQENVFTNYTRICASKYLQGRKMLIIIRVLKFQLRLQGDFFNRQLLVSVGWLWTQTQWGTRSWIWNIAILKCGHGHGKGEGHDDSHKCHHMSPSCRVSRSIWHGYGNMEECLWPTNVMIWVHRWWQPLCAILPNVTLNPVFPFRSHLIGTKLVHQLVWLWKIELR